VARTRNLKPGFFKNNKLAKLGPLSQLIFAGLWTIADREGRLEDEPERIKVEVLPYDTGKVSSIDVCLSKLHESGFILRYEVDGNKYISIPKWHEHQKPHYMEPPSEIPPPPGTENRYNCEPIRKEQRQRIFSKDNFRCVLCGSEDRLTIDHVIPITKGGSSLDSNLRTLCHQCNMMKGSRIDDGTIKQLSSNYDDGVHVPQRDDPLNPSSLNPSSLNPSPNLSPHAKSEMNGYDPMPGWNWFSKEYPGHRLNPKMDSQLWLSVVTPEIEAIIREKLPHFKASAEWTERSGQMVPSASRFLSEGRYTMEPGAPPTREKSQRQQLIESDTENL